MSTPRLSIRKVSFFLAIVGVNLIALGSAFAGEAAEDLYWKSAKVGDVKALESYLSSHPGAVDVRNPEGYTALIYAAYYGELDAVKFLLKKGADACAEDRRGNTALMGAIFKGNLRVARELLRTKCAVDQKNGAGQTALMFASLFGRKEIAQELVKKGASPTTEDARGYTAVSVAEGQGNAEMVKTLSKPVR